MARRMALLAALAGAGLLAGVAVLVWAPDRGREAAAPAGQGPIGQTGSAAPSPAVSPGRTEAPGDRQGGASPGATRGSSDAASAESASPSSEGSPLLVWTPGGLPAGMGDRLARVAGVTAHTVVAGDRVELTGAERADGDAAEGLAPGWVIPLDALAIDPAAYADVRGPDAAALADLQPGEAALGTTSARLRGLGVGGRLTLAGGTELSVTAVVDDDVIGAAELVVDRETGERIGVTTPRFALVVHQRRPDALEGPVRAAVPGDAPVRVRTPQETPYLRHGDAVLPQAVVKARFGEFAYRRGQGGGIVQEPAWRREHVVRREVPLLGAVRCHREVMADLAGALGELARRGLGQLIDPRGYRGCHHSRLIAPGEALSRHSWGIAVDVNVTANPSGSRGELDPRVVEAFREHGFGWGGDWLVPIRITSSTWARGGRETQPARARVRSRVRKPGSLAMAGGSPSGVPLTAGAVVGPGRPRTRSGQRDPCRTTRRSTPRRPSATATRRSASR